MKSFIVCGSRHGVPPKLLADGLTLVLSTMPDLELLVTGAAKGVDAQAMRWAHERELPYAGIPAQWKTRGPSAGPRRNTQMLDWFTPSLVVAFPGGAGTADMIAQAEGRGIEVVEITLDKEGT